MLCLLQINTWFNTTYLSIITIHYFSFITIYYIAIYDHLLWTT